ncbi:MAG: phospholipase D family protein [Woeseiaceae bacterium]|nr:phospholipase D family protein [Woeseiaceae bacterium]
MLSTLVGARLPERYHRFFNIPDRKSSTAIVDTSDTRLGQMAETWLKQHRAANGVYRLDLGSEALDIRLKLINIAERCVDIQSYLVRDDLSGNLIVLALIRAANRGVRVRLLMDDALTKPVDPGLLALGRHDFIEVRVFNPFPRNRSRFLSFIANFNLLNRRMHNKSFTVDNQVTIVGGRNLADEYFQTSLLNEFLDEDLLAIGNVVSDVSSGFDEYWNTRESMPIESLSKRQVLPPIDDMVREGEQYIKEAAESVPLDPGRLDEQFAIGEGGIELVPADARLVLDHPDKVRGLVRRQVGETTDYLRRMATEARRELIVVSPYFVPLKAGVRLFSSLVERGVRVLIVTNSLASTNHPSVHAVYARYRKPLLQSGVELYELRPRAEAADTGEAPRIHITLHSKVAVVDRSELFIGSFNLDPRSLYINTEMGMAVRSEALADDMARSIEDLLPKLAYRLVLTDARRLCWTFERNGTTTTVHSEPHTTMWRRFRTRLMSFLPIEGQM